MIDSLRKKTNRRWSTPTLMVASVLLIVSVAGAAERVVLGEYFTNQF